MPPTPPAPRTPSAPPTRRPGLLRRAGSSLFRWISGRPAPYPGDFTGRLVPRYDPHPDGRPDPGEVIWTWVPFEEDHRQGKDRPVLVVGHDGRWLLALQLTSKDHNGYPAPGGRPRWVDIGSGAWDRQRRPSEVRVDRVVRVDPKAVRREGAVLPRQKFEAVARAVADLHR